LEQVLRLQEVFINFLTLIGLSKGNKGDFFYTHIHIDRVKLSKDQDHGKVYGRLVWRGRPQPFDREIHSARKKQWQMVSVPNYATFKGKQENYDNLVAEAQQWFDKNGEWVNPELKTSSTSETQTA
jgi:hypothetical protein